jgi:hypothetical protein
MRHFGVFGTNQQARTRKCAEGMLFSQGGCTQGFNTFLTALKAKLDPQKYAGQYNVPAVYDGFAARIGALHSKDQGCNNVAE